MKVLLNGQEMYFDQPTRIYDMYDFSDKKYIAAKVDNRIRELAYIVTNDATIELLDLTNSDAARLYQATLRYLIHMATYKIFPNARLIFDYSVSRAIFARIEGLDHDFMQEDLDLIEEELKKIIAADYKINRNTITKQEAIDFYTKIGEMSKVEVIKYKPEDTVHIYDCAGYKNYMFGYMLYSTGFLKDYNLRLYSPGFLISYPRAECGGRIPSFSDEKVFRLTLIKAANWARISKAETLAELNNIVKDGKALEFINICEAKHNRQLSELGADIQANIETTKLICVAGPSSSGKTTFTNRLRIELMSRGITPLMISLDNFYKNPKLCPIGPDGKPDFEDIDALNRKLLDDCIYKLISGAEVSLPIYDFTTSTTSFMPPVKLTKNQVIMIEGIHALNDKLTPSIPESLKYKVYIAPLGQYRIDDYNPISISDIRLLRRIVRDYMTRATDCEKTLSFWKSVRAGEFKWIYPYQNDADFVFNSELTYELCVLKKYALPLLNEVKKDSPNYIAATRLTSFLKYYLEISDKWIPCNSVLREFIGGSIFYTEDKI